MITQEEFEKYLELTTKYRQCTTLDVKTILIRDEAKRPEFKTAESAGADLYAAIEKPVTIAPGYTEVIPLGFKTQFAPSFVALIYARSGLASKQGLAPANKVGVIDSDYRGEWMVALHNHSKEPRIVLPGDRIAQAVFQPVQRAEFILCDKLDDSERGDGGFGSTGTN